LQRPVIAAAGIRDTGHGIRVWELGVRAELGASDRRSTRAKGRAGPPSPKRAGCPRSDPRGPHSPASLSTGSIRKMREFIAATGDHCSRDTGPGELQMADSRFKIRANTRSERRDTGHGDCRLRGAGRHEFKVSPAPRGDSHLLPRVEKNDEIGKVLSARAARAYSCGPRTHRPTSVVDKNNPSDDGAGREDGRDTRPNLPRVTHSPTSVIDGFTRKDEGLIAVGGRS
jgi:hypothetical protein